MLRIVVIGLVVANLLLLGLQASKPTAPEEVPSKPVEINDSNVPTIHLFSELMQDDDLMSVHRRCYSLGPFRSTGELAKVRTRLLEVSTQVRERETQALIDRGYWLYMPPYKSAAEAMQALAGKYLTTRPWQLAVIPEGQSVAAAPARGARHNR